MPAIVGYIQRDGSFQHAECAKRSSAITQNPVMANDNLQPICDSQDPDNMKPCTVCGALANQPPASVTGRSAGRGGRP
jgi:hypothetical protein